MYESMCRIRTVGASSDHKLIRRTPGYSCVPINIPVLTINDSRSFEFETLFPHTGLAIASQTSGQLDGPETSRLTPSR